MNKVIKLLAWDTDFFGFRIGRVDSPELHDDVARVVDEQAHDEQIECVYLLLNAEDMASVRVAEAYGYGFYDIRMTFERTLDVLPVVQKPENIIVRDADQNDLSALRPIARTAYVLSRFYNDAHFNDEQCASLYDEWIIKSVTTDFASGVRVVVQGDSLLGYTTYRVDDTGHHAVIGLVGVAEAARGKQIGMLIFADVLAQMAQSGIKTVTVATQGSNIGAQRLYQRMGFISQGAQLWYHKWFLNR